VSAAVLARKVLDGAGELGLGILTMKLLTAQRLD